jgi:arabinofuranosyltransferase
MLWVSCRKPKSFRRTFLRTNDLTSGRLLLLLFLVLFCAVVLSSAWVSDDAYITFRSIDNWLNGYGLRWNVAERVQSYTHPLWMLAVSGLYAVTGEIYWSALALGVVVSVATVALVGFGIARSTATGLVAVGPLILSKAFVDYSTSGLENPLTHFLLAAFYWVLFNHNQHKNSSFLLALFTAFLGMNRLDALILVLPALLIHFAQNHRRKDLGALALGLLPLLAWEIFALIYYGFPLPNTAYAKLGTGIPTSALVQQGLYYFEDSLVRDPITLSTVIAGLLTIAWKPELRRSALGLSIVFYLSYIVWVGGDFMSGRLLSAPLLGAVLLVARIPAAPLAAGAVAWAAMLLIGFSGTSSPLSSGPQYGVGSTENAARPHGIADERAFYYPDTGLLPRLQQRGHVDLQKFARKGAAVRERGTPGAAGQALGLYGFYAGPGVHILDVVALSDPLLARLDARPNGWRIGHFTRPIPAGYPETLRDGKNRIENRHLAAYYSSIALITRGPLFSARRWQEILSLNLRPRNSQLEAYHRTGQTKEGSQKPSDSEIPRDFP